MRSTKKKKDLHRLIHAMSKSEKRYFTLDAQKSGKKNAAYLQLFKAIGKMDTYDEAVLKKDFKHLAVDKSYLYDAILRSMRDYHSKKSRAAQIKEKLIDAKYLYERELYDLCELALQEAKEMATDLGDHLSLLEINKQLRKVVKTTKKGIAEGKLTDLQEETRSISSGLLEEFRTLDVYDNILAKTFIGEGLKEEEKVRFEDQLEYFDKRKEKGFDSIAAEHRYYQALGIYHSLLQNNEAYFKASEQVMNWWDRHPIYKDEEFYNYIIDVSNFLAACFRRERFDLFNELLQRLEDENPSSIHHQKVLFQRLAQFKLVYSINLGIVDNAIRVAQSIEEGLSKFTINPSTEKVLLMNMAILLFIAEEQSECLKWSNLLIRNKSQVRLDINRGIYFIKLIAAYEIDDFDLVENTYRSANRFLSKTQPQHINYYIQFLTQFKKVVDSPLSELKEQLKQLKSYIELMRSEISGRVPLGGVDEMTMCWIDSRLERKSIAEIVKGN
ncbi:MAG: hypothetical protein AAGI23_00875 [Bacteroidota bacterium]